MTQLFPKHHVMGFIFSLVLTVVALSVLKFNLSYQWGMAILLITAFLQASVQLVMFMHVGESEDSPAIWANIWYMLFFAIVTVLGTLLTMVWAYQYSGV